MSPLATALTAVVLMQALPVAAQAPQVPPPPPAQPDAARVEAADRLLSAMRIEEQYDSLMEKMMPILSAQTIATLKDNVKVPQVLRTYLADDGRAASFTAAFGRETAAEFRKQYPVMRKVTAREYAAAFTSEELRELTDFYNGALGQKTLRVVPSLQEKIMPTGMRAGAEAGRIAIERVVLSLHLDTPEPTKS